MPALSSTMTEGKIVSWLKSPGDKVARGEALVVVESGAFTVLFVITALSKCVVIVHIACKYVIHMNNAYI